MNYAPILEIRRNYEGHSLIVLCPFCKKKHIHGERVVDGKIDFGTRLSHCVGRQKEEYRVILLATGLQKK